MKKKLRSAFKTSKYQYIEQKHDGPQEITVIFNRIVKIKDVVLSFIILKRIIFFVDYKKKLIWKAYFSSKSFMCPKTDLLNLQRFFVFMGVFLNKIIDNVFC
jgi:hypothetical protein